MSYVMDFEAPEKLSPDDTLLSAGSSPDASGLRLVCDPKSLLYLFGMQLDYSAALIGGGFKFQVRSRTQRRPAFPGVATAGWAAAPSLGACMVKVLRVRGAPWQRAGCKWMSKGTRDVQRRQAATHLPASAPLLPRLPEPQCHGDLRLRHVLHCLM
jgi:hypothetical protein